MARMQRNPTIKTVPSYHQLVAYIERVLVKEATLSATTRRLGEQLLLEVQQGMEARQRELQRPNMANYRAGRR